MDQVNRMRKPGSDEHEKTAILFFVKWLNEWMAKLAAVFDRELTVELQEGYIAALGDIPQRSLEWAFQTALKHSAAFPKPAELRELAAQVPPDPQIREQNYQRLIERGIDRNPKMLKSVLDAPLQSKRPPNSQGIHEKDIEQIVEAALHVKPPIAAPCRRMTELEWQARLEGERRKGLEWAKRHRSLDTPEHLGGETEGLL